MARVRVLIVDDSAVARGLVTAALEGEADLEVVGVAANGKVALDKVEALRPDVVTLDVEMPVMDGMTTLIELRKRHPKLPIIMFSPLTERAASTTLDALANGATGYATKPSSGSFAESVAKVREDLVSKVRFFGAAHQSTRQQVAPPRPRVSSLLPQRVDVLAVVASTGGPNALHDVMAGLPRPLPVPLLIVQHMPPVFTRVLAERLSKVAPVPIAEGVDGEALEVGRGYIAPGDFHLTIARAADQVTVRLNQGPAENSCRPAADVLLRSVAEVYGARSLVAVLTGMGKDGLEGARAVKAKGGVVFAQDEASSVVWGMPGFVAREGLADEVLPLDKMAAALGERLVAHPGGGSRRDMQGVRS